MRISEADSYRYGIVVDSGSSGSRIQIYKWKDHVSSDDTALQRSPPEIIQETGWQLKTTPGISSYGEKLDQLWTSHFSKLVSFAKDIIPEQQHHDTPIFILATAGMRLLPLSEQNQILSQICMSLKKNSPFHVGHCNDFVQIIDGSTEGIYGWLGLNYLSGTFKQDQDQDDLTSVGFMDMGGASTQIAFVPSSAEEIKKHRDDLSKVTLRTMDGVNQDWDVFVQTWLGFGANEARKRYLNQLIGLSVGGSPGAIPEITDPCLPKNCEVTHDYNGAEYTIKGLGNYDLCQKTIYPLLLKNKPCTDFPCLFNGVHVPKLNFAQDKFIGISEYWYTAQDVFNLGGEYSHAKFSEKVREFCEMDWSQILENSEQGHYSNLNPNKFLKSACFKASWVVNILHDGFELPKTLDSEHYPFSSANAVEGAELSWTLGKILLYASSQIPPSIKDAPAPGIYPSELSGGAFIPGDGREAQITSEIVEAHHNSLFYMLIFFILIFVGYKSKSGRLSFIRNKIIRLVPVSLPFTSRSHKYELADLEEGLGSPSKASQTNDDPLSVLRTRSTMSLTENNEDPFQAGPLHSQMPQIPGPPMLGVGTRSYNNFLSKPFAQPKRSASSMFYSFSENSSRENLHRSPSSASMHKNKPY